jgi:hypothetical protein
MQRTLGFVYCFLILFICSCTERLPEFEDLAEINNLPEPFIMLDGSSINSLQEWKKLRKPELKKLFQHYVYGYLPPAPKMNFKLISQDSMVFEGQATYKEVRIDLILPDAEIHSLKLALFIPNHRKQPAPVFVALNKCGNHALTDFVGVSIPDQKWLHARCKKEDWERGSKTHIWALENTIKRGYALATVAVGDIEPDQENSLEGIRAKYYNSPGDSLTKWGTIAAWAWGIHRVVDYLQTDTDIDTNRICATGWSRRGKTALFAAAMDERIDLVVPHQSGTGGMALSRMNPSESVERINRVFPHWFNGNFKIFGKNVNKLPIDQHLLVALVAPRPLLDNAGLLDTWASPHLALEAMKMATPVYELYGTNGILGEGMVRDTIGTVKMGRLLQYQRNTKHMLNIDYWNAMIDFADRQ